LSCDKPFHAVDEDVALQLEGGGDAVEGEEEVVGGYVDEERSLLFALDVVVLGPGLFL